MRQADRPLLVPRTGDWAPVIRAVWGRRAVPFLRYALCGAPEDFDRDRLAAFAAALAEKLGYRVARAYAASERVSFEGMHKRLDIGARALQGPGGAGAC